MEAEDVINLPASSNSDSETESGELHDSDHGPQKADSYPGNCEAEDDKIVGENIEFNEGDAGNGLRQNLETKPDSKFVDDSTLKQVSIQMSEAVEVGEVVDGSSTEVHSEAIAVEEKLDRCNSSEHTENGYLNVQNEGDAGNGLSQNLETKPDSTFVDDSTLKQGSFEVSETVKVGEVVAGLITEVHSEAITVEEKLDRCNSSEQAENGYLNVQNEGPIQNRMMDGIYLSAIGIKRVGMTFDDQQPSVRVFYNSLTRASKRKLEELLQQWSEWHAEHGSSSSENEVVESGEETYFPALRVGTGKSSAVSFWIESQTTNQQDKGLVDLDGDNVPLYDRGYALGLSSADGSSNLQGGLEVIEDASRCFNCGSYSHALKQCPRPFDNDAVNSARKQHMSKRNQNSASHNQIRYYQISQGGKYDDLKPGSLDAETRQLLGLGEFDPPPWLHRMREIGYPPGYLEHVEDEPSGIIIYADGKTNEEEDGEIIELERPKKRRKMTVEFPGVNAPIPSEADKGRWTPTSPTSEPSGSRLHRRLSYSSEHGSRGHYHEERMYRDFEDDGPPGVDIPMISPPFSYTPRYGAYDSNYSPHSPIDNIRRPRSPLFGSSDSDRGRSPLVYDDFVSRGYRSSSPYSSSERFISPRDHGLSRFENEMRREDDYHYSYRSSHDRDRYYSRW